MQIAMIGLGKMGGNMLRRLSKGEHRLVAYDRDPDVVATLADETGCASAASLEELVALLEPPRAVWLMLPAGEVTEQAFTALLTLLEPGDVLIDGANSWFQDSMERAARASAEGIAFMDAGVSGGVWGLAEGYALMVGGEDEAVGRLRPVLETLAPAADRGWVHCGPAGSGHFVKMVHNGIEYGMMQAYAEGFALLKGREDFGLDLAAIAECWRHGSVVRSWLLDLMAGFLERDQHLADIAPVVADSGEGRWTVLEAIAQGVPAPVITTALMARFESQGRGDYGAKLLAQLRNAFGGHAVKTAGS